MIDVLMVAAARDELTAALSGRAYWGLPALASGAPNPAYAFEPRVYVLPGRTDGEGQPVRSYLAHSYVWLTIPERDPELEALPCFGLAADRQAFEAHDPGFVRASNFTAEQLGASFVEPVLAGTRYPFGSI